MTNFNLTLSLYGANCSPCLDEHRKLTECNFFSPACLWSVSDLFGCLLLFAYVWRVWLLSTAKVFGKGYSTLSGNGILWPPFEWHGRPLCLVGPLMVEWWGKAAGKQGAQFPGKFLVKAKKENRGLVTVSVTTGCNSSCRGPRYLLLSSEGMYLGYRYTTHASKASIHT